MPLWRGLHSGSLYPFSKAEMVLHSGSLYPFSKAEMVCYIGGTRP
jgi:hypothetical protein